MDLVGALADVVERVSAVEGALESTLAQVFTPMHRLPDGVSVVDDFDGNSVDTAAWVWASDAVFTVPSAANVTVADSQLTVAQPAASAHFLVSQGTTVPTRAMLWAITWPMVSNSRAVGIRLDDGTDNNYCEIRYDTTGPGGASVRIYWRKAGGLLNVDSVTGVFHNVFSMSVGYVVQGTAWSSWDFVPVLSHPFWPRALDVRITTATGLAWTPTRWGVVMHSGTADAGNVTVEWYAEGA